MNIVNIKTQNICFYFQMKITCWYYFTCVTRPDMYISEVDKPSLRHSHGQNIDSFYWWIKCQTFNPKKLKLLYYKGAMNLNTRHVLNGTASFTEL